MQFKPVPDPPGDLESVAPILAAVPATADAVDDCCRHLVNETRLESRPEAETWLVFLRALGLVTADPDGYRRTAAESRFGSSLEAEHLQEAFRERVYGAETIVEILEGAEEPLTVDDVGAEYRESRVGSDYRRKRAGSDRRSEARPERHEDGLTERVRRLLEWTVLLKLADRTDGGRYGSAAPPDGGAE